MFHLFKQWINRLIFRIYHYSLLPLRYRINTVGIDELKKIKKGRTLRLGQNNKGVDSGHVPGFLFLANHPSHLDPILIGTTLVKEGYPVCIWTMDFVYKNPYAKFAARNNDDIRTLKVPNAHEHRAFKNKYNIRRLIYRTIKGLKNGENVLFFPAGYQKFTPRDEINGKSAVEKILRLYPDVNIVFVKIHGMWGSRFSKAVGRAERSQLTGRNWFQFLKKLIKMFLFNGIFFVPKRNVIIEFVPAKESFPRTGTRQEINQYIENFYNRGYGSDGEPLQKVPDFFWKSKYTSHEYNKKGYQYDLDDVPLEIRKDVVSALAHVSHFAPQKITHNLLLDRDIGLDSLEIAEILTHLEKKYPACKKLAPNDLTTVGHLMALTAQIPIQYVPIKGSFAVVQQEAPPLIKAKETLAASLTSFFGFFTSHQ